MNNYVCVIGGANIDIIGTPFNNLNKNDSNPGKTTLTLGGVARNIAENLSKLNINIEFITVLGNDTYAEEIQKDCSEKNISLIHSKIIPNERTSSYLCINDENGEMQVAISDMEIYRYITPNYLNSKLNAINNSKLCVVDTNIPEDSLNFLMRNCTVPIFIDTVSVSKTKRIKNIIRNIHTIKPNIIEAEILSDIKINNDEDLVKAANNIHNKGVKWIFISLGVNGVFFSDGILQEKLPPISLNVVNTTGAGDSFLAGVIWSYLSNNDIEYCAKAGLSASSICIQSPLTVSNDISVLNIKRLIENNWR